MSKNHYRKSFSEILVESIDEALTSLGDSIKTSIYYHLEKEFMIKRQRIPYDLVGFLTALEHLFGIGSRCIELLIIKKLYEKVNNECGKINSLKLPVPELSFKESIEQMKLYYEDKEKIIDVEITVDIREQKHVTNE